MKSNWIPSVTSIIHKYLNISPIPKVLIWRRSPCFRCFGATPISEKCSNRIVKASIGFQIEDWIWIWLGSETFPLSIAIVSNRLEQSKRWNLYIDRYLPVTSTPMSCRTTTHRIALKFAVVFFRYLSNLFDFWWNRVCGFFAFVTWKTTRYSLLENEGNIEPFEN